MARSSAIPGHIDEVLNELRLRERGFVVEMCDGAIKVAHPATGADSRFHFDRLDGEVPQANWLREALRGWPEPDLADTMPNSETEAAIARVLRERSAHMRMSLLPISTTR
jgi:hypothetical protein